MCMMCEGASLDDVRFHIHGLIEGSGWAVIPVEGNTPYRSWAYTVGLVQTFDHPELVVSSVSIPLPPGAPMASLVAKGEVRTLAIDRRRFERILRERPEASLAVMGVLCDRLRELHGAEPPEARS